MKYLIRILVMLAFILGVAIILLGCGLAIFLTPLQFPVWFVWKGEFLEDDDTLIAWYIKHVMCRAADLWEKILKWSRE